MCTLQAGTVRGPPGTPPPPTPSVTGSPTLPDLVLGHEVHALGLRDAHWFLRHGPGVWLSCTLLPRLSVLRRPGDRLPSYARRGGGATPGGGGAMGFSPTVSSLPASASLCALRPPPAHLPGPAAAVVAAVPLVLCGEPWGNIKTFTPASFKV